MSKKLNELTRDEIAQLFPVIIVDYQKNWAEIFEKERKNILEILGYEVALRIEHFGSTSIPDLPAKDTIDILLQLPDNPDIFDDIIQKMHTISYEFMWQPDGNPPYMHFIKGFNTEGIKQQTYLIHAGPKTHPIWDRIYFRDFLRQFPETARQYAELKIDLSKQYKYDRVGYRIAKTAFVAEITEKAKGYFSRSE